MEHKPRYPVYIPSKGRADVSYTARFFLEDGLEFRIVVEPQEYETYREKFGAERLLKLPQNNQGLIYARNWIRDHSTKEGFSRNWQFDDNIRWVYRMNKGKRIRCNANVALSAIEDFCDRYTNIGIAGLNYDMFALNDIDKPYYLNCHTYSACLFSNTMPYRWRLRMNDDVDICLQVVTGGMCTVNFNSFLVKKCNTMTVKGGCTTEYKGSKLARLRNAKILALTWPQYVTVVWKFNRWHFQVKDNWRCFHNKLIRRTDIDWSKIPERDDYGIQLMKRQEIRSTELQQFYDENSGKKT
jgi:hypothetical protein